MKFMFSQSLVQVPVKYVSVQCRGGLITVLATVYHLMLLHEALTAVHSYGVWTPDIIIVNIISYCAC